MDTQGRAERLKQARIDRGYGTAASDAEAHGWNRNTYSSNENGNAPYSYRKAKEYADAFGVRPEWLYEGETPTAVVLAEKLVGRREEIMVPVIGWVGADPGGTVLFATGQDPADLVPLPPGGTSNAVALRVAGHSMRGFADDGALIYFEDQRTEPGRNRRARDRHRRGAG
jgi:phage repressor protein C with HTH and peptisase S24 domain